MDEHTERFLRFLEESELEIAREKQRQEAFIKALEEAMMEIIRAVHSDYEDVPAKIHKRIATELLRYCVEINEYLDYTMSSLYRAATPYGEIGSVKEIDAEKILLKKCYEKSKALAVLHFPEIYQADSEVLKMLDMTCYISMHQFVEGFNFLCVDYLDYFYEE